MTNKIRAIYMIGLIVIINFGILALLNSIPKQNEAATIFFLPTQGQIHTAPGAEVPIDLLCFADKSNLLFADSGKQPNIQIDNSNLEITEYSIEAGSKYKDMRLYAISLTVNSNLMGNHKITKVSFEHESGIIRTYDIGEINVSIEEPWTEDNLDVLGHTASAGLGETYEFSLINKANQNCIISEIDFGGLTPYLDEESIYINNVEVGSKVSLTIKPGDEFTVKTKFKTTAGKDFYYVSPEIVYELANDYNVQHYSLPHALLGIPVSENKAQEIYENFF